MQTRDSTGRLFSEQAFEGVTQLTLDLGKVEVVRGIQVQGPLQALPYGIYCAWYWHSLGYYTLICLIFMAVQCSYHPLHAIQKGWFGGLGMLTSYAVMDWFIAAVDPATPGYFSTTPICISAGATYGARLLGISMTLIAVSVFLIVPILRPKKTIVVMVSCCMLMMAIWYAIFTSYSILAAILLLIGVFSNSVLKFLSRRNKKIAKRGQQEDIKRYETEWKKAMEDIDSEEERKMIEKVIRHANKTLNERRLAAYFRSDYKRGTRPMFLMRAGSMGRYTRTRKFGQRTADIDMIFEEAVIVNDEFLELMQNKVVNPTNAHDKAAGKNCELIHGIVKRPDRALQKVKIP